MDASESGQRPKKQYGLKPVTLKERQAIDIEGLGVRVAVLRVNSDGTILLGVKTPASAKIAIDTQAGEKHKRLCERI